MDSIISCENLTHYYGKRMIYQGLSFTVPRGRILGLLGKNGTGKTTTINILSGYLKPKSGVCRIFGHDIQQIPPQVRQDIGLLIEGHVQYQFMNIEQIERFYAPFYPKWNKEAYYELMKKLKVAPRQCISRMSCGQRSQVALGLILAQNPSLLVLDDFSLGLDPGYRRLFVDYLREYANAEDKTIFLTSHIIQDMERLIDDCIIMDYGKILLQKPIKELLDTFRSYTFQLDASCTAQLKEDEAIYHPSRIGQSVEFHSFLSPSQIEEKLQAMQLPYQQLKTQQVTLEEAFIGLTGKY